MERRGRRNRTVNEYLSPDLCREILCRLPVKDLLRFKSVCKTWRSIIDDPQFVSMHLTRYKNNFEGSHLFALEWRRSQNYPVIRHRDTLTKKTGVSGRSLFRPREFSYIVGSINGLFVLRNNHKDTLTAWNPSIRRHFAMPPFPGSSKGDFRLGFGFDPSTNDYKVVSVCQRPSSNSFVTSIVYLYTFQSGRWRVISSGLSGDRFPYLPIENVFIKGIIYWATTSNGLFLFDVGKETFSYCDVPNYGSIVDKSVHTIAMIFHESLALLTHEFDNLSDNESYCLWLRDQYANWIKLLTLNIEVDWCIFMCVKMNGELLFKTEKSDVTYNTNTHEMKVLARYNDKYYDKRAFEYAESLVWPMGV